MKLTFIGAAHEMTGSCTLLDCCGGNFLIDYGMEQGVNVFENVPLPVLAGQIDAVFLTHAHIDHSGMLPKLYKDLHSGYVHSRCDLPRNRADLGAACGGCVVSAAGACTVHEKLKKVDWQEIKKSLCRHPNWASAEALSYALKKLLYIVFAIRHPRRTFQQLLRRDFIELCKGDQIGGVGIAEAVLPRGNGLAADTQCFRRKLLRHLAADAVFLQCLAQGFGDSLLFLPHLLGINILFECLYD